MEVSVIIVNYNTYPLTKECIESVIKFTTNIFEIIVVDNASQDISKEIFSADVRIKYIYLNENVGFGGANNVGASIAKGKYLLFLNSDTIFLYNIIEKLFRFAEDHLHFKIGAIGTCLINPQKVDVMSFGQFISSRRIYRRLLEKFPLIMKKYELGLYELLKSKYYAKVDFISGADLFMEKKIFNELSKFDINYFMYYEETDLQKRMDDLGYNRYIINERGIIHLESGSFDCTMKFNRKLMITKSFKTYINKHFYGLKKYEILILSFLILLKDLYHLKYKFKQDLVILKAFLK